MEIQMKYQIFLEITAHMCIKCWKVNKLWFLVSFHIISAFQHNCSCRNTLFPDSVILKDELSILGWKMKGNIWFFFRNHSSYVYGRKLNKLSVLVTLFAIVLAFQHDCLCRNTFFPDSMMSKEELSTLGWKLGWNIRIF